jgi:hypothetical protein
MNTSEVISYAVGAIGLLVGVILHLRAQSQLESQQISLLKSSNNLASDSAKADEAEQEANDAEKTYDSLRDQLLSKPSGSGHDDEPPHAA